MTGPKSAKNHTLCAGQITRRTRHIERTRVPRRIIFIAYRKDTCATPNHFYQHMSDTYTMFRKKHQVLFCCVTLRKINQFEWKVPKT